MDKEQAVEHARETLAKEVRVLGTRALQREPAIYSISETPLIIFTSANDGAQLEEIKKAPAQKALDEAVQKHYKEVRPTHRHHSPSP